MAERKALRGLGHLSTPGRKSDQLPGACCRVILQLVKLKVWFVCSLYVCVCVCEHVVYVCACDVHGQHLSLSSLLKLGSFSKHSEVTAIE